MWGLMIERDDQRVGIGRGYADLREVVQLAFVVSLGVLHDIEHLSVIRTEGWGDHAANRIHEILRGH